MGPTAATALVAWLHITHGAKMLTNMNPTLGSREQVGEESRNAAARR